MLIAKQKLCFLPGQNVYLMSEYSKVIYTSVIIRDFWTALYTLWNIGDFQNVNEII